VPRIPVELVNLEVLQKFSAVAKKYQIPMVKITSGQRIGLERSCNP
jgi:NAD(P)H-nitrite reductase large subunit